MKSYSGASTPYKLGDLNRQEPSEIWNGRIARELRAAHYAKRGPLFCSGCIHAPHLPARRPAWLIERLRKQRLRRAEVRNRRERDKLCWSVRLSLRCKDWGQHLNNDYCLPCGVVTS